MGDKFVQININDIVRVKLTDLGRCIHAMEHDLFWAKTGREPPAYVPPKEDAEGWSEWQLWRVMELFGPHLGFGSKTPFETVIHVHEEQ